MNKGFYAAIDIGGTKLAAGIVTASGKFLAREKMPTPKDISPAKFPRIISDLLEEVLYSADLSKKDITGIGVGVPGVVDPKRGKIIHTPNIALSGTNLKQHLEKKFRVRVSIGNDVNLGVLGEKWLGAGRRSSNLVGLFIGTGIGGGAIVDNRLVSGSHGAACEFGHMTMLKNGPKCSCGNFGCLEAIAGRWAIERDIRAAIRKGRSTVLKKAFEKNKTIKSKLLSKALHKKDPLAYKIMVKASSMLGEACVSLRHVFDPDTIVLGGGVIEACGDFMLPVIKKAVAKDGLFSKLPKCDIVQAKLGDDAVMLGAAALAGRLLKSC